MPRAFDRRKPSDDHNPLKGLLDWTQPIQEVAGQTGDMIKGFVENLIRQLLQTLLGVVLDPEQALEDLFEQLPDWVAQIPGLSQIVEWITGAAGDETDLQTFLQSKWDGLTEALGNFTSILSGFGLPNIGDWITDLLGTKSTATTANSNAATSLGNWTSWLTGGSWANIGASVADFLGVKSTANTANSNATTALGNFTTLLSNASESTVATLGSAFATAKSNATTAISNFTSLFSALGVGNIGALGSDLSGTKSTANTADTNASTAISGIGSIRDGLYNKLTGLIGSGWTQSDADQALSDTQATLASAVAAIQALQTQGTNNTNSGNAAIVSFASRANASSLGSDFTQTYSGAGTGVLGITDGKGAWQPVNNSPRTCVAVYNALQTLSDYQIIGQAFASAPAQQVAGFHAQNTIIGRVDAAGTSYVFAEFEKTVVRLGCVVSGSRTVWVTLSTGFSFKAGQVYWLVCGTSGGARTYQILEGSTPIITWTEVGTSSQMGASYRYTGLIVYAYSAGFTTILPGSFTGFAFADNTPSTTLGCGFRLYRGSTGANIGGGSTDVKVPNNYFNNVQAISPGITHTAGTNNQITINKEGWWIFNIRLRTTDAMGIGSVYQALLWKGSTVVARAEQHPGYISGNQWPALTGTFIIYCNVGDQMYAGMMSTTAKSYTGDAAGSETYFAGSWLGLS